MALLVVQRGHVGRTRGATGAAGEQEFAIAASRRIKHHVNAIGHVVRLIDADEPLSAYRGDLFVAVHYDSSRSKSAHGASVGYRNRAGKELARSWKQHYVNNGWSRGFRGDNYTAALAGYYGVRKAVSVGNKRAFILEAGFGSNPIDGAMLRSPEGHDRVGISVAAAITDILGAKCPPPSSSLSEGSPAYPGMVRMGDRGDAVRVWQRQLNEWGGYTGRHALTVDGIFGPATNHVVVDFQRKRGLTVDGIAGPKTWHELKFG